MTDEIVFERAMTADEFVQHCKQTFSYLTEMIVNAATPIDGIDNRSYIQQLTTVRRSMMSRYAKLTGRYLPIDAYPVGWEAYDVDE